MNTCVHDYRTFLARSIIKSVLVNVIQHNALEKFKYNTDEMKFHVWFLVVFKDKDNKRINIAELQLRIRKISRVLTVLFSQDKNIKSQAPKNDENKRREHCAFSLSFPPLFPLFPPFFPLFPPGQRRLRRSLLLRSSAPFLLCKLEQLEIWNN